MLDVPVTRERLWTEVGDVALEAGARGHVRWPDGTSHVLIVDQVTPPRRLRWLWAPAGRDHAAPTDAPGWSMVELFVERAADDASRLTVTETHAEEPGSRGQVGFGGPAHPAAEGRR